MFLNRLTFGALAVACVAAAGAGGYFASRQNTVPVPVVAGEQTPSASEAPLRGARTQGTESVVSDKGSQAADVPGLEASRDMASTGARRRVPAASPPSARVTPRQDSRALEQILPASTVQQPPSTSTSGALESPASLPAAVEGVAVAPVEDLAAVEQERAHEPPQKVFEELVVSPNAVIGLQTETRISSETARIEDRVEAKVTRDVKVGDAVAIPAGARAIGAVTQVERGGKFKERARLGIRFTTLVLADGTEIPMSTETIYREGEAPGNSSAAKIGGGALGGAILGALLGGAKGAAIGATAGAGGGVAVVQAGDASEVALLPGSALTVRLLMPLTVTVEQQ